MENDLDSALAELIEAFDFARDISKLSADEMVEKVEEREPSFIEHIETMEGLPKTASAFLEGFEIWTVSRLSHKYRHIWREVIDAYFRSEAHKLRVENAKLKTAVWSDIEQILRDSGF